MICVKISNVPDSSISGTQALLRGFRMHFLAVGVFGKRCLGMGWSDEGVGYDDDIDLEVLFNTEEL